MKVLNENVAIGQDETTELFDDNGGAPDGRALTDSPVRPQTGLLGDRAVPVTQAPPALTFSASVNPLVAAASVVLSKLVAIKRAGKVDNFDALNKDLLLDIGRFRGRALALGAESTVLNEASYVLCTVFDEAVLTTNPSAPTEPGKTADWSKMSLLSKVHKATSGGENFFVILTDMLVNPVKHLHMLELMYLCLALDFQGKYRVAGSVQLELERIRDGLYRTIRHLRGDVPRELSPHWHGLKDQRRNLVRIVPGWLVVLFTLMCLTVMYSGFSWVLSEQRETVLEPYRQLDSASISPLSHDRDA